MMGNSSDLVWLMMELCQGCACDVPSHSYQYSFNPNPNWSSFYAPQREIREYLQGTAEKFGAMRFVKLSHEVEACTWNDKSKKWYSVTKPRQYQLVVTLQY